MNVCCCRYCAGRGCVTQRTKVVSQCLVGDRWKAATATATVTQGQGQDPQLQRLGRYRKVAGGGSAYRKWQRSLLGRSQSLLSTLPLDQNISMLKTVISLWSSFLSDVMRPQSYKTFERGSIKGFTTDPADRNIYQQFGETPYLFLEHCMIDREPRTTTRKSRVYALTNKELNVLDLNSLAETRLVLHVAAAAN